MRTTCLTFVAGILLIWSAAAAAQSQEQDNPGVLRPVTSQEIERLRRQINNDSRSTVEFLTDYRTQSGDRNQSLDFFRFGAQVNYRTSSAARLHLTGARTEYLPVDGDFQQSGLNLTGGVEANLTEFTGLRIEAGLSRFSTDSTTINALASIRFAESEGTSLYVTASRANVEESLLAATGLRPVTGPFAGEFVGSVMENRVVVGGSVANLPIPIDVFAEGGLGNREGSNIPSNVFKAFGGGAGYNVLASDQDVALNFLRASYNLNYFGFAEDRFGFGGASQVSRSGQAVSPDDLGSDGISPEPSSGQAAIGGYFSPENFFSHVLRLEARGAPDSAFTYSVSGFLGSQYYTGTSRRSVNGLSAAATFFLTDRLSLPLSYQIDNFGPFRQHRFQARLAVQF